MSFWRQAVPRKQILKSARRIVVKIGTSIITEDGRVSTNKISRLVSDIVAVMKAGREVIVVSSGAISSGAGALGKSREALTIPEKQALAAVGQIALMNEYRKCFQWEGFEVGQILLTEDDVNNRRRFLNARHTIETLLGFGVVPVVNENDSVVVKEIKFGDNDTLSAHVASLVNADLLVLLSDVDGFYRDLSDPHPVYEIREINDDVRSRAGGTGTVHGTGGMMTKIRAAEMTIRCGEKMIIASGRQEGILSRILAGEKVGTLFMGEKRPVASRKRWIALAVRTCGKIKIDEGAVRAVRANKKSLLASGIVAASGKFDLGDAVEIVDADDRPVGKGIVNYNVRELKLIMGKKTAEIREILGGTYFDEVINRDNLIVY